MVLVLDCETTTFQKGNPHATRNRLVAFGVLQNSDYRGYFCDDLCSHVVHYLLARCTLLVAFNAKFDLNWMRREYGVEFYGPLWDCQVAQFIARNQTISYPSLEAACDTHGLPGKLDTVKTEYWDKGIDTDQIPRPVLAEYLEQDVSSTWSLYQSQRARMSPEHQRLVLQTGWDTLCLAEMEWNGLPYDSEASLQFAVEQEKGIARVDADLTEIVEAPINWGSPKQFSTVLYGGELTTVERIQVPYKHVDMFNPELRKTKVVRTQHTFPRLVEPLRMHGEESLSVEEGVLKRLEPKGRAAKIIGLMQVRAKIAHLVGTYLRGLPRKIEAMGWVDRLHPSLNQCVAVTGRLSSSNPNGQNLDPKAKRFFRSRYAQ